MSLAWRFVCAIAIPISLPAQQTSDLDELVRGFLWPRTADELSTAEARLETDTGLDGISRLQMHDLTEVMRRGRPGYPAAPAAVDGSIPVQELEVEHLSGERVAQSSGPRNRSTRGVVDVGALYAWLVRELRAPGKQYQLSVWRDGRVRTLTATLSLGPYTGG